MRSSRVKIITADKEKTNARMESMASPEGVEDMLTAKPGGIPETIDGMERFTLNGGATVDFTVAPASRRVRVWAAPTKKQKFKSFVLTKKNMYVRSTTH